MVESKGPAVYSEIPLVLKRCKKCPSIFRVLDGSPQKYCGRFCMIMDNVKPKRRYIAEEDYALKREYMKKYKINKNDEW